ncbi:hypothetical protein EDD21DRAFT_360850 [Dissophora ornata]|nr:hypothetical protein EDD21DRAFT_360850 [Dissophora ornata]
MYRWNKTSDHHPLKVLVCLFFCVCRVWGRRVEKMSVRRMFMQSSWPSTTTDTYGCACCLLQLTALFRPCITKRKWRRGQNQEIKCHSLFQCSVLTRGGGTRLVMSVKDGLVDKDILLLAKVVLGLMLGLVLLHPGKAIGSSHLALFVILELVCLLELALLFVVCLGFSLALVFPEEKKQKGVGGKEEE